MKIVDLECRQTSVALNQPFKTALRTATAIETVEVVLHLDTGHIGLGSAVSTWKITGESLSSIQAAITGPIYETIKNRSILDLERLLVDVDRSCVANSSAKAAVDIALHDLYCHVFDLPLYALLGGRMQGLETDMTISIDEPEVMKADAAKCLQQGYDVLKIKVGNHEQEDIARIQSVKAAVGDHVRLRLDANQGWTSKQAVKMIQYFEDHNIAIEWVEQPVAMHDFAGLKFVRDRVATPIMADESVFSSHDAFHLLKEEAVDLLNIKLMKSGGIRRACQIADVAEAAGVACMMGSMMESQLSVTAAAHVATAHRNITHYDLDAPLWLNHESMRGGMQFDGKVITLPDGAGLGIEK
ncbi:dipeptide epimerase [Tuberibacillus sp. Marseille-P3662]|uniref:dipeptide epimerase n=1 Tax=Tuberibacillus sp. Marseille-P3662 TaxID=1965358 RepID=UPI000A1C8969|nr:dipeptide epimerase [Tuberibacillus sp. Marseille-P3662]